MTALLAYPEAVLAAEMSWGHSRDSSTQFSNSKQMASDSAETRPELIGQFGIDPATASLLSLATPPLILSGIWAANIALGTPYLATQTNFYAIPPEVNRSFIVLAPLGFSTGYLYAGEPLRGALVGLGVVAITTAGFGIPALFQGQESVNLFFGVTGPLMVAGLIGYGWWVHNDLDEQATRKNRQAGYRPFPLR